MFNTNKRNHIKSGTIVIISILYVPNLINRYLQFIFVHVLFIFVDKLGRHLKFDFRSKFKSVNFYFNLNMNTDVHMVNILINKIFQ